MTSISSDASAQEIRSALAAACGTAGAELSLQPIVSISESIAKGFEVFAHLRLGNERFADVSRIGAATEGASAAAFERAIIIAAAKAARLQLGEQAEEMPLHCAVSEALLDDPDELAVVAELLDVHPSLARALVFSVPARLFLPGLSGRREMIETLNEFGVRFAVEDWHGTSTDANLLRTAGASYIKQPAGRLLGLNGKREPVVDVMRLIAAADDSGLQIIATGVVVDDDAVNLIDNDIDLLTGIRFGEPRRLRNGASPPPARAAIR